MRGQTIGQDRAKAAGRPGWFADLLLRFLYFVFHTAWLLVMCALVFTLAGAASYWAVKNRIGGGEVAVPSLIGLRPDQALDLLHERKADLALRIDGFEFTPDQTTGLVYSQTPESGKTVKAGSIIRVRISQGSKQVSCPNLVGQDHMDAGIALRRMTLDVGNRSWIASAESRQGRILSQDPPAGTLMNPNDKVNLLISSGPAPADGPTENVNP